MAEDLNPITLELLDELKKIKKDQNFIMHVFSCATAIEDQEEILDFIKHGDDVDYETVSVLAMHLADEREK